MPFLDFTFNNPKIRMYFDGESDFPPTGEFMYVHTHFIENNFLSEIEVLVNLASEELAKPNKKSGVAIKLQSKAEKYGTLIGSLSEETAPQILEVLREIYQLCKTILK